MKAIICSWCFVAIGICNITAMKKHTCMDHTRMGHFLSTCRFKDRDFVLKAVQKMIEAGISVDAPCNKNPRCGDSCHPLAIIACRAGHTNSKRLLELLLKHCKTPNLIVEIFGEKRTILAHALLFASIKKPKILLQHGANPNDGMSLFETIDKCKINHLALLFAYGASPEDKHHITKVSFSTRARLRLENCHNDDIPICNYFHLLTVLASKGITCRWKDLETKKRQSQGFVKKITDDKDHLEIETLKKTPNFNIDAPCDHAGHTLLHYAIIYRCIKSIETLLTIGADYLKECCYGLSPCKIYKLLKSSTYYEASTYIDSLFKKAPLPVRFTNKECPICLQFIRGLASLSGCCKQIFHESCMKKWHQTQKQRGVKKTCPYCGTELYCGTEV